MWLNATGCLSANVVTGSGLWGLVGNRGDGVAKEERGTACRGECFAGPGLSCCE